MDENDTESVFKLITSLCGKFHNDPDKIKTSRSRCYEILLGKRIPKYQKAFKDLKGTEDPFCNLLSWQLTLIHDYDLRRHANEIEECTDSVQISYGPDTDGCKCVLQFLLSLRSVPTKDNSKMDLTSLPPIAEFENFNKLFKLPTYLLNESAADRKDEGTSITENVPLRAVSCENKTLSQHTFNNNKIFNEIFKDEGYYSPPKTPQDNIWELASKLKYSDRRNWENFGYPEPDKERPFLSELGDLSSLWVENLESLYMVRLFRDATVFNSKMRSRRLFIRDLKFLLVGMASDSFSFDERGAFYLTPGVTVEGITPDSLRRYCTDLIFSGTCYKALNRMSTPNSDTGKYKYGGYIFAEFCESISRYLKFYRTAAFNIPDSTNFLQFHEHTYQLRLQIATLTSICKVGPYTESEDMPHGVALLNYLYQRVLSLTEEEVIIVLYSILYPCCQVYFSRFLKQWILEGSINDPYGEFFLKPNFKYISTRGRTYWTRSYSLREDIVPDFLVDLRMEILNCGKTMNLLKLCVNSSKLCVYLMGKKPAIISCCLTLDQLSVLRRNTTNYYLEVCTECGSRFNLNQLLTRTQEQEPIFMGLIANKRATTLRRIVLEKQKILQEQNDKKIEEITLLREQYDLVLQQKQSRIAMEIERELRHVEQNLDLELKRQKLVREEADKMVEYYSKLFEIAEERKSRIVNHINKIKSVHIEHYVEKGNQEIYLSTENLAEKSNSSTESFYSVSENVNTPEQVNTDVEETKQINSSDFLDIINANESDGVKDQKSNKSVDTPSPRNVNENIRHAIDNFERARRNKYKVMTEEMGIANFPKIETKHVAPVITVLPDHAIDNFERARRNKYKVMTEELGIANYPKIETKHVAPVVTVLTDAQKNKLKVLSEFIDTKSENLRIGRWTNASLINRNRVMGISDCFEIPLDNDIYVNKNICNLEESNSKTGAIKKSKSLMLDFDKLSVKSHKSESEKPIPMSVDSTPLSDVPHSIVSTPSTMFSSIDTNQGESIPNTGDTHQTDEGFKFEHETITEKIIPIYQYCKETNLEKNVVSKRVTQKEAAGVSTNCLKLFLHECVQIPLITQTKLVNNELLRYFITDLNYLEHLTSLRDYFFLLDGEFGRNITENLFAKLYEANFPTELVNCRTLQDLVFGAMDMSSKFQGNSSCVSFKINSLPKCFDLGNPDVLDCLSLTYKVKWPLNILLPTDTIAKYDEVFKYLLKLNRVSWVLKRIFLELKILAKETGKKEIYLMSSPQYRKLHQCRHIMTHFIQTLQNYIVGAVLQSSWKVFEKNLATVTNLDEIYSAHTTYLKSILFMCLLNQRTVVLRNVIQKIFIVILKFFDYLRSRSWIYENGCYIHPNFDKLENIFRNFEEFVLYLFKVGRKVAKSGYHPHLIQLLDMLDINAYYTRRQISSLP